jgi:recombination protein RecT
MATQIAERTASPITVFRQTLTQPAFREQLKMALPSHISEDKFIRVALTAAQQNPDLLNPQKVDRNSLFGSLVRAAQDGLLPDGREGAIVPFRGKAQWMPMVNGIMTKVRRSGEIAAWEASAVYERDTFERLLGDDQRIYHKPFEDGDPGQVIGAYSIVTFKDGTKSRDYMPRWRIEKAREQNPVSKNSLMWTKFYDEGAVKTVIRHHSKRLPMSTDVEAIFERDETMTPPTGYRAPELVPDAPPLSRLDAIEHSIEPETEPPVEPEVITEQAEELEAEIEAEPATFSLGDQIADRPGETVDAETGEVTADNASAERVDETPESEHDHPGTAIADALIAEINAMISVLDISTLMGEREKDIAAMLPEDGVRVEVAADRRKAEIREQQAKAKESAE